MQAASVQFVAWNMFHVQNAEARLKTQPPWTRAQAAPPCGAQGLARALCPRLSGPMTARFSWSPGPRPC